MGWGFIPPDASKFGDKPVHQIIVAYGGTLIFAIILAVVTSSGLPTGTNLLFALLSGAGWGFGQIITIKA
ncbi:GRP family sugar transporter, partial [Staphylococcus aureus]|uniref:GRP family sugar transporter n=1 Tax=Staphylococcus aureus TaxID=1280 RepID=UPI002109E2B6